MVLGRERQSILTPWGGFYFPRQFNRLSLHAYALAEVEPADTSIGSRQADGMLERLGHAQALLPDGPPLGKRAHLRQAQAQSGTREHGGRDVLAPTLIALLTLQQGHGAPVGLHGLTIVPLDEEHQPQRGVDLDRHVVIPAGYSQGEGALGGRNG